VEEMQEGTVTLNQDGLILYANRQFAAMMKAPVESIVGSHIHRFLAPERHPLFSRLLANEKTEHQRTELTLRAADGTQVPVHVSLNWLRTGDIQTICVVINDLTEQRHYEAMVEEGELSRLILEQAAEAIVVIDARGMILRASESAQKLRGETFCSNLSIPYFNYGTGRIESIRLDCSQPPSQEKDSRVSRSICFIPKNRIQHCS
jgi:PAS domain S-box-containing protein